LKNPNIENIQRVTEQRNNSRMHITHELNIRVCQSQVKSNRGTNLSMYSPYSQPYLSGFMLITQRTIVTSKTTFTPNVMVIHKETWKKNTPQ
jgi:hypothetical protein